MLCRSLLAAFFGNIVGALFVAIPHTYFYLRDYDYARDSAPDARHMRNVEEGEGLNEMRITGSSGDSLTKRE